MISESLSSTALSKKCCQQSLSCFSEVGAGLPGTIGSHVSSAIWPRGSPLIDCDILLSIITSARSLSHSKSFVLGKWRGLSYLSGDLLSGGHCCTEKLIPEELENYILKLSPLYLQVGGF